MNVVSNASPLINLAHIGALALLPRLYAGVVIPEAVWREVVVEGSGQPGATEVRSAAWISVGAVENRSLVQALRMSLDAGEAEAIALALETPNPLLLMDERAGRSTARYLGLRCVGIVGILTLAKQQGLIEKVRPYLMALRDEAGFRLSAALCEEVLREAGEE
jgi:predicted nucleic acid-binding protein